MHLPPQAYTKETLIQAYNWLRSQPAHVQELAKSPDALVALYSKAQIHGENYLSRTNLQGFKAELKNLAHMMGELEEGQNSGKATTTTKGSAGVATNFNNNATLAPTNHSNANSASALGSSPASAGALNLAPTHVFPDPSLPLFNAVAPISQGQDLRNVLDARSWTMIQEVKNHFNLSNEAEAVRLLIAMGYQKMRSQF